MSFVRVTVTSSLRIPADQFPQSLVAQLSQDLRILNPEWATAQKADRRSSAPKWIEGVRVEDGFAGKELIVPLGAWGLLSQACRQAGIHLDVVSELTQGEALGVAAFAGTLRPYQEAAVQAMVKRRSGILVLPCGAGKTIVGLAGIAALGRSALILVHTRDLLQQWRERARDFLGLEAGTIGDGKRDVRPLTIGMMQSMVRMSEWEMGALGGQWGTVLVDECQHIPCSSVQQILERLRARYRFGLTATPEREDGLTPMLNWTMGGIIYQVSQQDLIDEGFLVVPAVVDVETGWTLNLEDLAQEIRDRKLAEADPQDRRWVARRYQYDPAGRTPEWMVTELYSKLAEDPDRNRLIVELAHKEAAAGRSVLVLCNRKAHCAAVAQEVSAAGIRAEALTSAVSKKKRAALLEEFRSGELQCIAATQLADEGLDVPCLDRVILAAPTRAQGRTIQRLGRLMRPAPDKGEPVLYDLVDDLGIFKNQSRSRHRAYREALGNYRQGTTAPRLEEA